MLAGEDAKAMEQLARYKTPADFLKANQELRTKLSERPAIPKLADNATPEQITEYRKAMGVPDAGTVEAYGIKAPDGYELSEVEKGMLGDFAKTMHGQHMPASAVKAATDFFFKSQAANQQALNRLDIERQQEWQPQIREKWGKDTDAYTASANAFLDQVFADRPEVKKELLEARLPGGGRLGDHPDFFNMAVELAIAGGHTDRIEAASYESGGKSLAQQQQELEKLLFTNKAAYDEAARPGGKLDKIYALRQSRGELDESGNEVKRRRSA